MLRKPFEKQVIHIGVGKTNRSGKGGFCGCTVIIMMSGIVALLMINGIAVKWIEIALRLFP